MTTCHASSCSSVWRLSSSTPSFARLSTSRAGNASELLVLCHLNLAGSVQADSVVAAGNRPRTLTSSRAASASALLSRYRAQSQGPAQACHHVEALPADDAVVNAKSSAPRPSKRKGRRAPTPVSCPRSPAGGAPAELPPSGRVKNHIVRVRVAC